jgi:EmrB/QacA subfamily drug resistance transporter
LCFFVAVVPVGVFELVGVELVEDEEDELLLPHPATAIVLASTARAVRMAVSGVLLMGRAPIVARRLGGPPYQAPATRIAARARPLAAGRAGMSVELKRPAAAAIDHAPEQRSSGSAWLLAVCCVAQFMVILDLSIVNVALPHIQSALGFTAPQLQWVVDAYAIAFAGFLMLGGRAADHFGQRLTFVIALAAFGVTSLIGGLAPEQLTLIGARGVQGVAAALMAACSLAIITASFPPGPKLHRAIGTWAAMNGLGGSAGVLLGGVITEALSWRWVLLINPPIAIGAAFVAYRVVTERRRAGPESTFDLAGALTLTLGQIVLVFGVVEAGLKGWSTFDALGPIAIGILLLGLFGVIETRVAAEPLIPFKALSKPLQIANNIVLLFSATIFPMWILSSLYLQQVLGLSPLHTGLIFLPMTLVIMLVASRAGKLVSQFGVRAVLGGGLTMLTAGMVLLARIGPSGSGVVYIMIPGLLTAAGIAMSIVPSTIAATQGAKEGQAGLASGLVNTSRQVGGGLGLAVLITLATQHTTHLIGGGEQVPDALTHGFRLGFEIGAGLAAAAALMTFAALPRQASPALPVRRLAIGVGAVLALFAGLTAAFAGSKAPPIGKYTLQDAYSYVSAPSLHPPKIRLLQRASADRLAPGYIFTANFLNLNEPPIRGQSGPLILDRDLQPVWFQPVPERVVAANLSLQRYEGKPVLAWWQGFVTNTGSTENGEYVVVDQHYRTVARLKGADGWVLTLHEIAIDGDKAWVTANKNIARDLSRYGGAYNGALIDSAVQEYDLRTGRLLRNWDALDHIPLGQSEASLPTNGFPWDAYHVNSIDLVGAGKFLVSMRNTWAAYLVDAATGKIEWTLGGKDSDFRFARGAAFQWQHDVTMAPDGTVALFDDHCCRQTGGGTSVPASGPSRAVLLKLDRGAGTATLLAQYGQGERLESEYMGDTRRLAGGGAFIGWGSEPYFSEYDRSGRLLFEGELPGPDLSYRASLEQWEGEPLSRPAGAALRAQGKTVVYASWNGATRLASWRVLAGSGAGASKAVATHAKEGFETAIEVPQGHSSFKLQALDKGGRVIGSSQPFALR